MSQWAGQSTVQGRRWHHWNADLRRRMIETRETPCATCGGRTMIENPAVLAHEVVAPSMIRCPDCEVETPAVEAINRALRGSRFGDHRGEIAEFRSNTWKVVDVRADGNHVHLTLTMPEHFYRQSTNDA